MSDTDETINPCPFCGEPLKHRTWSDERGIVETDDKCQCGYRRNLSFGYETIELPTGGVA